MKSHCCGRRLLSHGSKNVRVAAYKNGVGYTNEVILGWGCKVCGRNYTQRVRLPRAGKVVYAFPVRWEVYPGLAVIFTKVVSLGNVPQEEVIEVFKKLTCSEELCLL